MSKNQIDTTNALTINEIVPLLKRCLNVKMPAFLWAGPGIGKSSIVAALAKELNGTSIDMRMSQMAPTDICGIPYYNKDGNNGRGSMDWAPPSLLPSKEFAEQFSIVILFLDEMNSAAPAVQAAAYQLVNDRRCGEYILPENVVIIAAGNREGDRGVTYRMPAPLANRFVHYELKPDFDSWLDWAIKSNINSDVIAYLTTNRADLYDFDPANIDKSFATPRSWEFVSRLLKTSSTDAPIADIEVRSLISAAVGSGMANKYMAYLKVGKDLPKPIEVMTGKVKEIKTQEISAHYQIIVSTLFEMREFWHGNSVPTGVMGKVGNNQVEQRMWNSPEKQKLWMEYVDNFFTFIMKNFSKEVGIMATKMAFSNYYFSQSMDMSKLKTWTKVAEEYMKFMQHVA